MQKDKRHFKRYRKQSGLKINLNGRTFSAKTIDYSFDGIGALVEDTPPITKGAVVDVDVNSPNLRTKGEVVWARKSKSGLLVGIKRLDFPREGKLEDFPLADIVIGLQRSSSTGVLQVGDDAIIKKIYIKNGDMVFAVSNQNMDRLGDILLREGKINLEQYNHSVEQLRNTGKRQGTILVQLGYIKPQELVWAVRHYVEEIILSLFSFEKGKFKFIEANSPSEEMITLKLSAANIIYRGIKRIANPQNAFNFLRLSIDTVLSFSSDPLNLFQDITLDAADRKILSYIDGKTSIKVILSLSSLNETETLKSLYALLSTRMIEVKSGEDEIPAGLSAEDVIEEPDVKLSEEFMDRVEGIYSTYETLGYYGILGIKQWAPSNEIKKAYYKAAKEFHPDRHFRLKSDEVKGKLNTIFSYLTQAYTTLSNPLKRAEHDRVMAQKPAVVVSNEDNAKLRFEEGKTEYRKGNYSEAFRLFGQAVYLDNDVADYHFYYGLALMKLKRLKEAERAVNRALAYSPSNGEYITELGFIYLQLGFPHRAKSNFEKAIKIEPANKRANEGLQQIQE